MALYSYMCKSSLKLLRHVSMHGVIVCHTCRQRRIVSSRLDSRRVGSKGDLANCLGVSHTRGDPTGTPYISFYHRFI